MFNVRLASDHLYGKLLYTWLSLVMSVMVSHTHTVSFRYFKQGNSIQCYSEKIFKDVRAEQMDGLCHAPFVPKWESKNQIYKEQKLIERFEKKKIETVGKFSGTDSIQSHSRHGTVSNKNSGGLQLVC